MRPLVEGSAEPLVRRHDAVYLDLDGVLYVGSRVVEGAAEVVGALRRAGLAVAFVTNNASRTPAGVAAHLTDLGIHGTDVEVVTSAQAAAAEVARFLPSGAPVLVVGGEGVVQALLDRGLRPVRSWEDQPQAVVQGFAPDVGWRALTQGTFAVRAGVPWVATNLDVTVPTDGGAAPGNGTLVGVIAQATGRRPVAVGKPEPLLYEEASARTGARRPVAVGDRLDTDIEGANRAGLSSLLVLTGVTTVADLVGARPDRRPGYVSADLEEGLLRPHPTVRPDGPGWQCGGWTCAVVRDHVELHGDGDRTDAVRALCLAVWGQVDRGTAVEEGSLSLALERASAAPCPVTPGFPERA